MTGFELDCSDNPNNEKLIIYDRFIPAIPVYVKQFDDRIKLIFMDKSPLCHPSLDAVFFLKMLACGDLKRLLLNFNVYFIYLNKNLQL